MLQLLSPDKAEILLREEIRKIKESRFFDYSAKTPSFPIDKAMAEKGLMLGLMVARTKTGEEISFKAFSGQLHGSYIVHGFVPPCLSQREFNAVVEKRDGRIHELTGRIGRGEEELIEERAELSHEALKEIEGLYKFYTPRGTTNFKKMGLKNIPTGTGDCAAPKLFSHAFKHGFEPLSLSEIYFGKGCGNKVDGESYTPCDERCTLIMKHILGVDLLYSDDDIAVVSKPSGELSVPGRGPEKADCTMLKVHELFPSSPIVCSCHRLDMDTSGVLVYAKTEEAKKKISLSFERREAKKEYVALLRGVLKEERGTIDIPIRLDTEHRPMQIADYENGKEAMTDYERIKVEFHGKERWTRVRFFPRTGRTHQLRVHASLGLNMPIVGDNLYGEMRIGERLMLHAEKLSFPHPRTGEYVTFTSPCPF